MAAKSLQVKLLADGQAFGPYILLRFGCPRMDARDMQALANLDCLSLPLQIFRMDASFGYSPSSLNLPRLTHRESVFPGMFMKEPILCFPFAT
jgi:hypothetical protein